ncbi:MAG: hypothetical protein ACTSO5_11025, partial [Candidatus Heimdallarchaeaceae archaeon]
GIQKPPRKIKVRAIVETIEEEKIATVELIHEKVDAAARPQLDGIAIPGELEDEDEEEEEEEDGEEVDIAPVETSEPEKTPEEEQAE